MVQMDLTERVSAIERQLGIMADHLRSQQESPKLLLLEKRVSKLEQKMSYLEEELRQVKNA